MNSLDPAAIQFMLECLQKSAGWSGCFLLVKSWVDFIYTTQNANSNPAECPNC